MTKVFAEVIPPYREHLNENVFSAVHGFRDRGYEVVEFEHETDLCRGIPDISEIYHDLTEHTPVIGSISAVKCALRERFGVHPNLSTYPEELRLFMDRKIQEMTVGEFMALGANAFGKFIKPQEQKRFTGLVIETSRDLITVGQQPDDLKVWVSPKMDFLVELRCFILDGKVLDARPYKGDIAWLSQFNLNTVRRMAEAFAAAAPCAYSLDVGVTLDLYDGGYPTRLVEVNDAYALGSYGLSRFSYCDMITARWKELVSSAYPPGWSTAA